MRFLNFVLIPFFILINFLKILLNFVKYKKELKLNNYEKSVYHLVGSFSYDSKFVFDFFKKDLKRKEKSFFVHKMNIYYKQKGKLNKKIMLEHFFNKRKFVEKIIHPAYYYPNYSLRKSLSILKKSGELDDNLNYLIKSALLNDVPVFEDDREVSEFDYREIALILKQKRKLSILEIFYLDQFILTNDLNFILKYLEMPWYLIPDSSKYRYL